MVNVLIHQDDFQVEVPLGLKSLDEFRRWARSDAFPEHGRWVHDLVEKQ